MSEADHPCCYVVHDDVYLVYMVLSVIPHGTNRLTLSDLFTSLYRVSFSRLLSSSSQQTAYPAS
jgi:hypothetical protein